MAISNSLKNILRGFGHSTVSANLAGTTNPGSNPLNGVTAAAEAATSFNFNAAALAPASSLRTGYIRVTSTAVGSTGTAIVAVYASPDAGTTLVQLAAFNTTAAGELFDYTVPFNLDTAANYFRVIVTMAVAAQTATVDLEVVGNP